MIERLVSQIHDMCLCEVGSRYSLEPLSLLEQQMGWQCSAKLRKHIYGERSGGESHRANQTRKTLFARWLFCFLTASQINLLMLLLYPMLPPFPGCFPE